MQLAPGHYVFVQTKSKLFKNSASGHPEFIMSTHSIVRCAVWQSFCSNKNVMKFMMMIDDYLVLLPFVSSVH